MHTNSFYKIINFDKKKQTNKNIKEMNEAQSFFGQIQVTINAYLNHIIKCHTAISKIKPHKAWTNIVNVSYCNILSKVMMNRDKN